MDTLFDAPNSIMRVAFVVSVIHIMRKHFWAGPTYWACAKGLIGSRA